MEPILNGRIGAIVAVHRPIGGTPGGPFTPTEHAELAIGDRNRSTTASGNPIPFARHARPPYAAGFRP